MIRASTPSPHQRSGVGPAAPVSPTAMVVIMVAVVAGLYFGQQVLVPLALAILLSFALAPVVVRLHRWGLGRVPSVVAVVVLVFIVLIGFGIVVASQVIDLADNLPTYERNIRAKIQALHTAAPTGGIVERTSEMVRNLNQDLAEATQDPSGGIVGRTTPSGQLDVVQPVPVEIQRPSSPLQAIQDVTGPLIGPLATAGIVLVFMIFMLLERSSLRDRLIRLAGANDVRRTTEAMDDAARRVSRYLLMQLVINILYGIPVAVGLYFIGVPNPLLWGLLATVLRFIPYVGPVVAALFPIALSIAVDPGWTLPLLTVGLFVGLELFSNNVLEPWLYGSSTGLSPMAIIVAAAFWTMLWGPVGLLLATPLTVCLVVLGRHVPQLGFLDVLLGNEPVLATDVKFYQRILARDPDEATELAEECLEDEPLDKVYDEVILPALQLAEQDRLRGGLDRETVREMAEDTVGIVDYLADEYGVAAHEAAPGDASQAAPAGAGAGAGGAGTSILCIGARNGLDDAAASALARLLAVRGANAKVLPRDAVSVRNLPQLDRDGVGLVCLSYVNPAAHQHAHRLVRRLRQHFGGRVRILVGLWTANSTPGETQETVLATLGADLLATSLRQAVVEISEKGQVSISSSSAA